MAIKNFKIKKGLDVDSSVTIASGDLVLTAGQIHGPSTFVIDPAVIGDSTGEVRILGSLRVDGTTTTIKSSTLSINDKNIVLADSAPDATAADGAGITINGAGATLTYAATGDKFVFNKPIDATLNNLTTNIESVVDSEMGAVGRSIKPLNASQYDLGDSTKPFKDGFFTGKLKYSNVYSAEGDLPSAATYHGMFAHVHATGAGYFAHGGNWIRLANKTEALDSALTQQLISAAYIQSNQTTYNTSDFPDSSGVNTLADARIAAAGINSLSDVNTSGVSSGQVLKWSGAAWEPANDSAGAGGGGSAITVQDEGSSLSTAAEIINFVGAGVTASGTGTTKTITISGGGSGTLDSALTTQLIDSDYIRTIVDSSYVQLVQSSGGSLTVQDEGSSLSTAGTTLNFVGDGVVASGTGTTKTITISGGGGGGIDSSLTVQLVDSDYVQARMLGINSSKITEFKFIADSGQQTFSGNDASGNALAITSTNHQVFMNGIRLLSSDFTASASANSITMDSALDSGDELVIITQGSVTTNDRFVIGAGTVRYEYTADSGQTAFSGSDKHGTSLAFDSGQIDVFLNGIMLTQGDYTQNGTTNVVTLTTGADSADEMTVIAYNATLADEFAAGQGKITKFKYNLTNGQTAISGADVKGNTLAYAAGNELVFLNGLLLEDSDDYATTSSSVITLTSGANSNDELVVQSFANNYSGNLAGIVNPTFKDFRFIADSGDTTFSGNDAAGQALALTDNNFSVFLNGIRLLPTDYTANTTSNSITLSGFTAADSDEIVISTLTGTVAFNDATKITENVDSDYVALRQFGIRSYVEAASDITLKKGFGYIVDCSATRTLTLPASATLGDEIRVIDGTGQANSNNITINRNSHKINGATSNHTISTNRQEVTLLYYNATQGWVVPA